MQDSATLDSQFIASEGTGAAHSKRWQGPGAFVRINSAQVLSAIRCRRSSLLSKNVRPDAGKPLSGEIVIGGLSQDGTVPLGLRCSRLATCCGEAGTAMLTNQPQVGALQHTGGKQEAAFRPEAEDLLRGLCERATPPKQPSLRRSANSL